MKPLVIKDEGKQCYAMGDDGMGFNQVSWQSLSEQPFRKQIAATARGDGVSCETGDAQRYRRAGFSLACLIHISKASRVACLLANYTWRWVLCCMMRARVVTWSPRHTFRTLRVTRSHPRSLLSMPRVTSAVPTIIRRTLSVSRVAMVEAMPGERNYPKRRAMSFLLIQPQSS